ncbi:MAG: PIG-L family deacetylase [Bryobacteraceae bacterium]
MRRAQIFLSVVASIASFAAEPLAEDRGAAGAHQALRRLQTTARVLYVTAHPDDEDGATIAYLSRGMGAEVTLLSLTRGESGANLMTGDFFDSLGALRTVELTRAARYYGCKLRFTSSVDYGYSKNIDEAWRNWDREQVLAEVVRVVREERPHVILARWQGTARDGHGHHSAAGVMAREAYEAAADGKRFPEAGAAWQASKLYADNRRENDPWTIRVDAGVYDPILGRSYAQIARDGLREQRTQGAGAVVSRPGESVAYYSRVASRVGGAEKETSFFEGLNVGPAAELAEAAREAMRLFRADHPEAAAPAIAAGLRMAKGRSVEIWQDALRRVLGIELEALVQPASRLPEPMSRFRPYETFRVATRGQEFRVATTFHNRSGAAGVTFSGVELLGEGGWAVAAEPSGLFRVRVGDGAPETRAFWHRDSVKTPRYTYEGAFGTALPRPALLARATYEYGGVTAVVESEAMVSRIDESGVQRLEPLTVGPALSVRFASEFGVLPVGRDSYRVKVVVRNVASGARTAEVSLKLPAGWKARPERAKVEFQKEGEESAVEFGLEAGAGDASVRAAAVSDGVRFEASFEPRAYGALEPLYVSRPALHTVRRVDVRVRPGLRIGYVMGTGDDVPATLDQLGVPYDLLDTATLAGGDLSRYTTILVGIRAYAARSDVRTYNQRLLDYVANGGVLIVQYNTPEYDGNYGPFPYTMGRNPEEVSEEDSPVTVLEPDDPVFQSPNRIAAADFEGWVEQRGSKFLTTWDPRWKALLETHDHGQAPQKGGWLVARHGRGLYVYCAYAWYRQLPFAVPGAVRLFANLISQRPTE